VILLIRCQDVQHSPHNIQLHPNRITSRQFDTFPSSNLKSDCTIGTAVSKLV
jgi:hypothetical protein